MSKIGIRDVSPVIQILRNILLGRNHTLALRFEDKVATRSPPLPELPDGPSHLLSANYYYSRDARDQVCQPEVLESTKQLEAGQPPKSNTVRVPGKVWQWD